jgi:hypothetical protein
MVLGDRFSLLSSSNAVLDAACECVSPCVAKRIIYVKLSIVLYTSFLWISLRGNQGRFSRHGQACHRHRSTLHALLPLHHVRHRRRLIVPYPRARSAEPSPLPELRPRMPPRPTSRGHASHRGQATLGHHATNQSQSHHHVLHFALPPPAPLLLPGGAAAAGPCKQEADPAHRVFDQAKPGRPSPAPLPPSREPNAPFTHLPLSLEQRAAMPRHLCA